MKKRQNERDPDNPTPPPASSHEFTSLLSKYSYSAAKLDEFDTNSSTPVTLPVTPDSKSKKIQSPASSPRKRKRNPGYADPSVYSHIPIPDLDSLSHDLIILLIGLNPGAFRCPSLINFRGCYSSGKS